MFAAARETHRAPPSPPARAPRLALPPLDFVAIDTETTGLAWHDRLVEIGAVRFRGDRVVATWRTLVDPRRPIPSPAAEIHGITDDAVLGAPLAREALLEFQRFCGGAALLAHNARFDRDVLAAEFVRAGLALPGNPFYCTWRLAKHCVPEAPRHKLATLAEHLTLPAESSHRALADAELTRQLFLACCARMREGALLAALDAHATERGAPLGLRGAVRRVQRLPEGAEALRALRARGEAVTLRGGDGSEARGVPGAFYARGGEARVDLHTEGREVVSLPLAGARVVG